MTRRSEWPEESSETSFDDCGGLAPSRAGAGSPRSREVPPEERARAICLRLLTVAPRTRRQLADALRAREVPESAIAEVLDRLQEVGLVDYEVFAAAWVDSRHHGRGLARRALAGELRTRGVDAAIIERAVERLDGEQEEETARALVARRLRATRGLEEGKRVRRLVAMLARRGYAEGTARRVVREALREEGEDPEILDRHLPDAAG
ncbi:regulatory protein RecX [Streptomyces sp. 4N509B]|uniref:regulatory protein RecX n=1 Tax=Streptomyces sp. 4N509B TaxID=3457413 RepID=UPI003FD66D46